MSSDMQATNEAGALKEFDVTIVETLTKTVRVGAVDRAEAEQAIKDNWRNGRIELDSGNFFDVEFQATTKNPELAITPENTFNIDTNSTVLPESFSALPLIENEHVLDLLDVLERCGKDTSGLTSLINYVSEMDGFVKRMEDTISSMKTQLDSMKNSKDQPLKNYLSNTIAALEEKVAILKEHINNIKSQIVESCKKALTAFKETGISALSNIASFFKIKRDMIQYVKNVDNIINANDKTVSKIEAFTKQYHAAGSHIKNMARVAVGKESLTTVKEAGKLSKAVAAPYLLQNKVLRKMKSSTEKAISGLEKMEEKQAEKKAERELVKKPSLLEKLAANKNRVEQTKLDVPIVERAKAHGVEV